MNLYTRYNNETLFQRCQDFVPHTITKGENFNHWWDAAHYLTWVIEKRDQLAINIDVDCFITDWSVVEQLVSDFKQGGYSHAGVSDSAYLGYRKNISWAVMNPFFNLFRSSDILTVKGGTEWDDIHQYGFRPEWNKNKPPFVPEYERSQWEPFNGLFNWLFSWGKPLWLEAETHSDDNSTILKYQGKPFAIHTWYSRFYGGDSEEGEFHTTRIDDRYKEALLTRKR
jgi:hypothetical protein